MSFIVIYCYATDKQRCDHISRLKLHVAQREVQIPLFMTPNTSAFPNSYFQSLSLSLLHCHPNTNPVQM